MRSRVDWAQTIVFNMRPTSGGLDRGDVTELLSAWSAGDAKAFDRVMPLVFDELHRMAARYLAGERSDISLQATGPGQ